VLRRHLAAFARPLALLIALLTGAAPAAAQRTPADPLRPPAAREFRHSETIWMGFHEASGYSNVELRPVALAPDLALTAMFVFKGRTPATLPPQVSLALTTTSGPTRFTGSPALVFLLDGSRLAAGPMLRVVDSSRVPGRETLAIRLPVRTFLRVLRAEQVELIADGVSVALADHHLEALRDLASRMDPRVYADRVAAASAVAARETMVYRKTEYEPTEVDRQAAPASFIERPQSIALLPRKIVKFEFVVDTTGRVDLETLKAADPDADAAYVAALRVVAARWEFTPAVKDGQPVRQRLRQAMMLGGH
jgi:hypothetical protein